MEIYQFGKYQCASSGKNVKLLRDGLFSLMDDNLSCLVEPYLRRNLINPVLGIRDVLSDSCSLVDSKLGVSDYSISLCWLDSKGVRCGGVGIHFLYVVDEKFNITLLKDRGIISSDGEDQAMFYPVRVYPTLILSEGLFNSDFLELLVYNKEPAPSITHSLARTHKDFSFLVLQRN